MTSDDKDDDYLGPYKISDLTSLETLREAVLYVRDHRFNSKNARI